MKSLVENQPETPFDFYKEKRITLKKILDALEEASKDRRVKGLILRVHSNPGNLAQIQELREALEKFAEGGRKTYAFSEIYDQSAYYLATACQLVYLQPHSGIELVGISSITPFFKGTLEKLGIEAEFERSNEYKTATNMFTEKKFTKEHRETTESLVSSIFSQIMNSISKKRGIAFETLRELLNKGPFLGNEALEHGLVDDLLYRDEVKNHASGNCKENFQFVPLLKYNYLRSNEIKSKKKKNIPLVALIYAVGQITLKGPSMQASQITVNRISNAFKEAIENKDVKAIVLRIDSPGGDVIACEAIHRQIILARKSGKKVIASLGGVAASGGYYLACACDEIVAEPGSIIGSIGVFAGKPNISKLFEDKLGITVDSVSIGDNAHISSIFHSWSDPQKTKVKNLINNAFQEFVQKVADGRNKSKEDILPFATGEVWTSDVVLEKGLVDKLGGLSDSIELARKAGGLEGALFAVKVFPEPKTLIEILMKSILKTPETSDEEDDEDLFGVMKSLDLKQVFSQLIHDGIKTLLNPTETMGNFLNLNYH